MGTYYYFNRGQTAHAEQRLSFPYFSVGVVNNPKFDKRWKGGEDGCSVSQDQKFIMVCDGVGGWVTKGVDPGKTSKFISRKVSEFFDKDP